ncbi:PucR family transcriptional regulator [Rhodococcus spongiicola]|uniref:PucR family transcriptional regulator n=1 Tax=Rhodococcus spongiicola TaxID=2487352 RepID=A0A3S3AR01_9NOCA|nr:helix-turn-helix domain-containing protein [Rhodococcus spongiicola]RVW06378.1 PucR family transcriptional regulator [Rhodococcus spongiicola]
MSGAVSGDAEAVARRRLASVPASADDAVLEAAGVIARRIDARKSQVIRSMTATLTRKIDELDEDPQLFELGEACAHGNMSTILGVLANDVSVDHMQPTTAAVEYALRLAQRDMPSHWLVRAYHMWQEALMKACYCEVEALGLPGSQAMAVLEHVSDVLYSYVDWITIYVFDAYEQERRRWIEAHGSVHSSAICNLLTGAGTSTKVFEAETGYRLDQTHIAVILWSPRCGDDVVACHCRFARSMAQQLGTDGSPITSAIDRSTVWAWLPFGDRWPCVDTAALTIELPAGSAIRAVLGLPGVGIDGFRRSHEQALAAHAVTSVSHAPVRPIVSFGDPGVAAVALLAENLESTRAWVWQVLGSLAEDTDQAATLRTTLSTYLDAGESHLHTAQQLQVHRNTVKYRINKTLGDPETGLADHSKLDLALALEVCRFLGPTILRTSDA